MIPSISLSVIMVIATVLIHYNALRWAHRSLDRIPVKRPARLVWLVFWIIGAHLVEVLLYAWAFYALAGRLGMGELAGLLDGGFREYVYFSAVTFSSLGFGDVHPVGPIRLVTGIEAINGLILIGWSAAYTYLTMERLWNEPPEPPG